MQKLKNCYDPLNILEAAYLLLSTVPYSTAVQAQKIIMFTAFLWAKNTARGVRFLLVFNMYLFLAQFEQVYLFLAIDPKK